MPPSSPSRMWMSAITSGSLASVFSGDGQGYPPCTAQACLELLDYYGFEPTGRRAVVVGRSLVIGRPAAMLLLKFRNATVTLCHTRTADLAAECRRAELLIAAAGRAGIIGANCLSPGQVVIDVGMNWDAAGHLVGDVDFAAAEAVAGAVPPVPGGVGAVAQPPCWPATCSMPPQSPRTFPCSAGGRRRSAGLYSIKQKAVIVPHG